MRILASSLAIGCLILTGCGKPAPTQPSSTAPSNLQTTTTSLDRSTLPDPAVAPAPARPAPGRPGYEEAYANGQTYLINAIEVPGNVPEQGQADFYEVVYPQGWQNLGIGTPQCNPCDHDHNGIDAEDYHDHILDSVPSSPGGNAYKAPWHVWVVVPNYTSDSAHNSDVTTAYAAHIPTKSEDAVNDLLAETLPDGSHIAVKINTNFYFLCAVVSPNAAP